MVRVMLSYWNQKFADFEEQERGVDHLEQEVQQAVNTLDNYRQYFTDYMPELTKFGLKVVAAILIFIGGRKVIQWIIYLIKASMEKASVDKDVYKRQIQTTRVLTNVPDRKSMLNMFLI